MIIQILSVILVFIVGFLVLFVEPYLDNKKETKRKERITKSITKIEYKSYLLTLETYPKRKLIDVEGYGELLIKDIDIISIDKEITPRKLILDNVRKIEKLSLICDQVEIFNSPFRYEDFSIIDKHDNVIEICKDLSKEVLISITDKYGFTRNSMRYLTNAPYAQISRSLESFRISKPYNEDVSDIYLICPKRINKLIIRTLEINIDIIDYLYINNQIERIILERSSLFRKIKLQKSDFFKLRNRCLVETKKSKYVHCGANKFRCVSSENPTVMYYNCRYKMNRMLFVNNSKKERC